MIRAVTTVAILALAAPATAWAQTAGGGSVGSSEQERLAWMLRASRASGHDQAGAADQARSVMMVGAVETRITTGRPYSAEAVTETLQVLGDGNRIQRSTMTRVHRDGQGRTRRETYSQDGTLRSVAISDPVDHVSLTLDPVNKTALKTGGNIRFAVGLHPGTTATGRGGRGGVATASPATVPPGGTVAGAQGRGGVMMRSPAHPDPNVRTEDLGSQNIEGVLASGTRTTTTIPAGQIGNVADIKVVSEQWFSEELQVLVLTKHSDPRSGETTYRLRNILRAEPDPTLFTVPPDYTVQTRAVRSPQ